MARIDVLPSIEIIRGLKGILDFYVWKGLPCVRAWPTYRPAKQTAASLAAALVFGAIVKSYSLLGNFPLEAYREDALDQPRTARDIMVTGVYGNLHEASMSDFLDLLQDARNFLSDLTALLNALHSVNTDELVVRTEHSVLPDGAATAAAQATQLTALQKIDDLQDALESKALDRFLVRGMDQLHTYNASTRTAAWNSDTAAGLNTLTTPAPPAGTVWLITHILAWNTDNAIDRISIYQDVVSELRRFATEVNPPAYVGLHWDGLLWLDPGIPMRVEFHGCVLHDHIYILLFGQTFTLET